MENLPSILIFYNKTRKINYWNFHVLVILDFIVGNKRGGQAFHRVLGINVLKTKTTAYLNPINDLTSPIVSSAIFLHFSAPV
jgi:hypothetical protein